MLFNGSRSRFLSSRLFTLLTLASQQEKMVENIFVYVLKINVLRLLFASVLCLEFCYHFSLKAICIFERAIDDRSIGK